ncbi:DUF6492 family protein [Gayadomonas joobiniege]|uniref:DUF6492 family protein n=1 Tax=Gayadomonas joobiniege TaxID=1234606 RepID=UPI00035F8EC0|nr:DUF6492 family protein [Gayadomonas joobiniege]
MSLGAVLPLSVRGSYDVDDLGRTEILLKSLSEFTPSGFFNCFLIVTPPDEVEVVRKRIQPWSERFPIRVESEETLVPELKKHRHIRGWRKQQLVKLAAANYLPDGFYLTFDADVICLRPIKESQLIINNKAIIQYEKRALHPKWWRSSARILKVSTKLGDPEIGMSVTPAILATELSKNAMQHIGGKKHWADYLCRLHNPKNPNNWRLSRFLQLKWTEYSLYYLSALKSDLLHNYHICCGNRERPQQLLVHDAHPFESWQPAKTFAKDQTGLFCVVGSKSMLEPAEVWQTVAPYIKK